MSKINPAELKRIEAIAKKQDTAVKNCVALANVAQQRKKHGNI